MNRKIGNKIKLATVIAIVAQNSHGMSFNVIAKECYKTDDGQSLFCRNSIYNNNNNGNGNGNESGGNDGNTGDPSTQTPTFPTEQELLSSCKDWTNYINEVQSTNDMSIDVRINNSRYNSSDCIQPKYFSYTDRGYGIGNMPSKAIPVKTIASINIMNNASNNEKIRNTFKFVEHIQENSSLNDISDLNLASLKTANMLMVGHRTGLKPLNLNLRNLETVNTLMIMNSKFDLKEFKNIKSIYNLNYNNVEVVFPLPEKTSNFCKAIKAGRIQLRSDFNNISSVDLKTYCGVESSPQEQWIKFQQKNDGVLNGDITRNSFNTFIVNENQKLIDIPSSPLTAISGRTIDIKYNENKLLNDQVFDNLKTINNLSIQDSFNFKNLETVNNQMTVSSTYTSSDFKLNLNMPKINYIESLDLNNLTVNLKDFENVSELYELTTHNVNVDLNSLPEPHSNFCQAMIIGNVDVHKANFNNLTEMQLESHCSK